MSFHEVSRPALAGARHVVDVKDISDKDGAMATAIGDRRFFLRGAQVRVRNDREIGLFRMCHKGVQ